MSFSIEFGPCFVGFSLSVFVYPPVILVTCYMFHCASCFMVNLCMDFEVLIILSGDMVVFFSERLSWRGIHRVILFGEGMSVIHTEMSHIYFYVMVIILPRFCTQLHIAILTPKLPRETVRRFIESSLSQGRAVSLSEVQTILLEMSVYYLASLSHNIYALRELANSLLCAERK